MFAGLHWNPKGGEPKAHVLGKWGERRAERHLRKQGLKILGRRVRVGRRDEIDLIGRTESILVIVEVKTRAAEGVRPVRDAVTRDKQRALSRAAVTYARRLDPRPDGIRFDIVEVIGRPGKGRPKIRHLPSAFRLAPGFRY